MSAADFLSLATLVSLVLIGIALLIAVIRIIIGPTLGDRVLALDLLTLLAMGFIATFAIRTGLMLYLDIAIAVALLGFLATIALARYIMSRAPSRENRL